MLQHSRRHSPISFSRDNSRPRAKQDFAQTIDHILTLRAVIEEARHRSFKVYCCFLDFWKAFDSVPREYLF